VTRRYARGLVIGKFAPLHLGHEHLVNTARAQCGEVLLISYSRPEMPGCTPEHRERWLRNRFPDCRALVVTPERVHAWQQAGLSLPGLPANDDPPDLHRLFVARLCLEVLRCTVDAVFTSEDYGDGLAEALGRHFGGQHRERVTHVEVDRARQRFPVSGTQLRQNPHGNRHLMAPAVYADFVERICLLGGESSGKSTLAQALARALGTRHVPEYGRDRWIERGGYLPYEDMLHIAQTQVAREDAAAATAHHFLACDTSPLTTLLYSRYLFRHADPALEQLAGRHYHHTFLCAPDIDFTQDGTRASAAFRERQHAWHLDELAARGIPYRLVGGPLRERVAAVLAAIGQGASPGAQPADAEHEVDGVEQRHEV
jgi:NadR type nicotinamide-nucleotide adenylyltransferase